MSGIPRYLPGALIMLDRWVLVQTKVEYLITAWHNLKLFLFQGFALLMLLSDQLLAEKNMLHSLQVNSIFKNNLRWLCDIYNGKKPQRIARNRRHNNII